MTETTVNAFEQMDSMYRYQRYFYDVTRKYYLLGRDKLLDRIELLPGQTVAEIGCGTGRNLEILARRYPHNSFYGLDASEEMLRTARSKIEKAKLDNVSFQTALAEDLDHQETFGLGEPFDVIFFSYAITMIPTWREAIDRAVKNLKPGGRMYIVDFYDQLDLPAWFRIILKSWLRQFHVQFRSELLPFLYQLDLAGVGRLEIQSIARRYAFIADFHKAS